MVALSCKIKLDSEIRMSHLNFRLRLKVKLPFSCPLLSQSVLNLSTELREGHGDGNYRVRTPLELD
jgi:hypothetical protein